MLCFTIFLNIMCSPTCLNMSVIVIFLDCLINSTVPLSPDSPTAQPWKPVYPGSFTVSPKYPISIGGGGKELRISCSQSAVRKTSEITTSPSPAVDS